MIFSAALILLWVGVQCAKLTGLTLSLSNIDGDESNVRVTATLTTDAALVQRHDLVCWGSTDGSWAFPTPLFHAKVNPTESATEFYGGFASSSSATTFE